MFPAWTPERTQSPALSDIMAVAPWMRTGARCPACVNSSCGGYAPRARLASGSPPGRLLWSRSHTYSSCESAIKAVTTGAIDRNGNA